MTSDVKFDAKRQILTSNFDVMEASTHCMQFAFDGKLFFLMHCGHLRNLNWCQIQTYPIVCGGTEGSHACSCPTDHMHYLHFLVDLLKDCFTTHNHCVSWPWQYQVPTFHCVQQLQLLAKELDWFFELLYVFTTAETGWTNRGQTELWVKKSVFLMFLLSSPLFCARYVVYGWDFLLLKNLVTTTMRHTQWTVRSPE